MSTIKDIVIRFIQPPIPIRKFDWNAHREGDEETAGQGGFGKDPFSALEDLFEKEQSSLEVPLPEAMYRTEEQMKVVEAMMRYGGSFVSSLGKAFVHADARNFEKLRAAFPHYWYEYEIAAGLRERDPSS